MDFLYVLLTAAVIVGIGRLCGMHLVLLPTFQSGETILYRKQYLKFATALSSPSYRWSFSLPPLMEHGLYVTNRRILHVVYFLRLWRIEFSQWFKDSDVPPDADCVKETRIGLHWLAGSYVQITSKTSEKLWYRSMTCRVRIYTKDAETLGAFVDEAMQKE